MQAVKEEISFRTAKVIVFPSRMSTTTTPPAGQQPPWNPHWYGNLAQWVAPAVALILGIISVSLVVHYRNVDSSAKSSDEHTNALIDAKLDPAVDKINDHIDKKLEPMQGQLTDLATRIAKLEGRFDQLDADQKRLTKLQLNKLSDQIAAAQRTKRRLELTLVARLGNDVLAFTNSNDPEISSLAWHTAIQVADYRTILNQEAARPLLASVNASAKVSGDFAIEARVLDPRIVNFGIGYDNSKVVPFDQAARYEKLDNPIPHEQFGRAFYIASGTGVELLLDGYHLKNVVFHDVQINYSGGPLVMQNVYFVNCTFHIQPSHNAQQLTTAVLNSTSINFQTPQV
ncbi:MAG: hypothetical protein ABSF66_06535 [Terriglobales bacterium]|jgi:hypothetical protein